VPSTQNSRSTRVAGPYAGVFSAGRAGALSLSQVDGKVVSNCVSAVVERGDAILFGRTSDGGALSIRVLSDGATDIWYPTDASELSELLEAITALASK
jgi:hypothetical protein